MDKVLNPAKLNFVLSILESKGINLNTLSFADLELMVEIFSNQKNIRNRIQSCTNKGDDTETNFYSILDRLGATYKVYSKEGSQVDFVFGVDCLIYMKYMTETSFRWHPVQIKATSKLAKNNFISKIGGISIFPENDEFFFFDKKNQDIAYNFLDYYILKQ